MTNPKLKVGLMIDSLIQPLWVWGIINDIQNSSCAEINLVIDVHLQKEKWANGIFEFYKKIDKLAFPVLPDPFILTNTDSLLRSVEKVSVDSWNPDTVKSLQNHNLDVVLRFGCEWIEQESPIFTRYGIWVYRHDNGEFLSDLPVTHTALIALTGEDRSARILRQSWTQTYRFSFHKNHANAVIQSAPLALRTLQDIYRNGSKSLSEIPFIPPVERHEFAPIGFLWSLAGRILHQISLKLFSKGQWCLGIAPKKDGQEPSYELLVPPADRFWADPFVYEKDNRSIVFFEECEFKNNKGYISAMEISKTGGRTHLGKVLEQPYHLSYPCVFDYNGDTYMVPECSDHGTVDLYKCRSFPKEWALEKILLSGIRAADATIQDIDGRWWMFVTIQAPGTYSSDDLHLYYADNPLGDWTPHPQNPVKSDVRSSRPAGKLFQENGQWYRPAQDGSGLYGSAIVIQRIVRLTTEEFKEEEVRTMRPTWHSAISRTHTLNQTGRLIVTDAYVQRSRFRAFKL